MSQTNEPVALKLVDREFLIACAPEERAGLVEAADYLDRKMRELRANARTPGFDRLAVLAAISVTHELLSARRNPPASAATANLDGELAALRRKLEAALDATLK